MNITYVDNIISEQIQSYQRCKNKLKSIDGIYNFKNKKKTSKSIYFTFEKCKSNNNNNNNYNNGFTVDDYKIDDIKEIRVSIIYNQIEYNNNNGCNIIHTFKNPDKVLSLDLERFNPLAAPNVYFIDKYECYTPYKAGRYKLNFEMIVTLNDGRIFTSRKQMNCIETMPENKCVMVDSFVNYSHRKMIINQHSLFLTTNAKEQLIKKYINMTTTTTTTTETDDKDNNNVDKIKK